MKILSNINEYTVTQLNKSIKNIIENSFVTLRVSGEVSQVKNHSSGHVYFTLKDKESTISAICWRSNVARLKVKIEEGSSVLILGRVTTYSPQSKYQLIVEQVEYQGQGALLKMLEERKQKLKEEGLFDLKKKKPLPNYPSTIGVITSESGAVINDIIHRIKERFPLNIILYPAKVQGEDSVFEICEGIDFFNNTVSTKNEVKPNVIIIARGGGSLEDLMPFNDEKLVRKIYSSRIPVVSAVGHETDVTLCDFVADIRAPTPSAAAEIVVPNRVEILLRFEDKLKILEKAIKNFFNNKKREYDILQNELPDISLKINNFFQHLDVSEQKLISNVKNDFIEKKNFYYEISTKINIDILKNKLELFNEKLSGLKKNLFKQFDVFLLYRRKNLTSMSRQLNVMSYKETIRRGFAVIRKNKKIIRSKDEIKVGEKMEIEFFKDKMNVEKVK